MKTFKQIDCVGSWIAVVDAPVNSAIELPDGSQGKPSGICVVVGLGPNVRNDGLSIGDKVVVANKRYITIESDGGDYEGTNVYLMLLSDVLVRKDKGDNYEVAPL